MARRRKPGDRADSFTDSEPAAGPRRALVFSGGGARGAYEAGVVRYLAEELPRRLGRPVRFDLHCGTSVGAIHACFMAATADEPQGRGARLVDVWSRMRVDEVLPLSARDLLRLPGRLLGLRRYAEALRSGEAPDRLYGLLDTRRLEKLVVDSIPWKSLKRNVDAGIVHAVCVAATQIATGRVTCFVETRDRTLPFWGSDPFIVPRLTHLLPAHALASASIPLLFPAVRVGSTYYADGGLRLNTPLAPALRLGADRVLVVALRQPPSDAHDAALARSRIEDYASPLFLFGKILNALLLDPVDSDLQRMRLMNEILIDGEEVYGPEFVDRISAVATREGARPFKKIQDLVIRPSTDLSLLAGEALANVPESRSRSPLLRLAARGLSAGGGAPEADLVSYLLFDGEFLAPLAELGTRDARAHEEELARFFSDD